MSQYALNSDFVTRYDMRPVADLLSDTGSPVAPSQVLTNTVLTTILQDASADVDAALFRGNRYTPAQLTDLSATSATLLTRLVCDMAMLYLKRRRGKFNAEADGKWAEAIEAKLESIRNGENYLMLAEQTEAIASTEQLDQPKLVRTQPMKSVFNMTRNYFPWQVTQGNRRPGGCCGQ